MRLATFQGRGDQLELASGRILPKGVPTEVTEEEARFLAADSRAYLGVSITDGPEGGPDPDEEEADQ